MFASRSTREQNTRTGEFCPLPCAFNSGLVLAPASFCFIALHASRQAPNSV